MENAELYDSSPYKQPEADCPLCVEGMLCPDGEQIHTVELLPAYWRSHQYSFHIRDCPLGPASCPGGRGYPGGNATNGTSFYADNLCAVGHTGPSCTVCDADYYISGGKGCVAC